MNKIYLIIIKAPQGALIMLYRPSFAAGTPHRHKRRQLPLCNRSAIKTHYDKNTAPELRGTAFFGYIYTYI